ncbi:MAG: hypothetical protein ACR2MA_07670 [Egibacteraceae bacterium]
MALAAGFVLFVVSSVAEAGTLVGSSNLVALAGVLEESTDLLAYVAVLAAAWNFISTRRRANDREVLLDALTLILSGTILIWQWGASGRTELTLTYESPVWIAMLLLVAAVVAVGIRLGTESEGSMRLLLVLTTAFFVLTGHAARLIAAPPPSWSEALLRMAPIVIGITACLPSMHALTTPRVGGEQITAGRVFGLGAGLLVSPAVVLLWSVRAETDGLLLGVGLTALTVLIVGRACGSSSSASGREARWQRVSGSRPRCCGMRRMSSP